MRKLTASQHKFVCEIISGKTYEAAYASAFPRSRKWTRAVRDTTASKTLKKPHVQAFFLEEKRKAEEALREEVRKKNLWNKKKSIEVLVSLIKVAYEDLKVSQENQKKALELAQNGDLSVQVPPALSSVCSNTITRAVTILNDLTGNEPTDDEKSLARRLIDLDPDMILDDPNDYAVSILDTEASE